MQITTSAFSPPLSLNCAFSALTAPKECADICFNSLLPQEQCLISPHANQKRKLDFALGRIAAHAALSSIDPSLASAPILKGHRDEPLWPDGIIGSISHSANVAAAVAAETATCFALGLDLQHNQRKLSPGVSKFICHPQELGKLSQLPFTENERLIAIFSAKESIYKALYPICQRFFGFHDVMLFWDNESSSFKGELLTTLHHQLVSTMPLEVHCIKPTPDFILTWVYRKNC